MTMEFNLNKIPELVIGTMLSLSGGVSTILIASSLKKKFEKRKDQIDDILKQIKTINEIFVKKDDLSNIIASLKESIKNDGELLRENLNRIETNLGMITKILLEKK